MLFVNLGIWSIVAMNQVYLLFGKISPLHNQVYVAVSVWIFTIGYFGFHQPALFPEKESGNTHSSSETQENQSDSLSARNSSSAPKYAKTLLSVARKEEIKGKMEQYFCTPHTRSLSGA